MNYFVDSNGVLQPGPPARPQQCLTLPNLERTLHSLRLGGRFVFEAEICGARFVLYRFRRDGGGSYRVAVRVQKQWPAGMQPEAIQNVVRREVCVLQKLESVRFQYAPKCVAFCLSFDNPIRQPFLVLEWVAGQPLVWTKDHPAMDLRIRVLTQLFQLQQELIDKSLESRDKTAKQFYMQLIHDKIMGAPRGPPGMGGMPTQEDYWGQLTQLDAILGPNQGDRTYAVAHNNLVAENIIVDSNYNIKCIVGWSYGGIYPLGQTATLPRLFTHNTGNGSAEACMMAERLFNDKIQYRHPLHLHNVTLTPARQAMMQWQNAQDAELRALYMQSMQHSDVLAWLARHGWRIPRLRAYHDVPMLPGLMTQPRRGSLYGTREEEAEPFEDELDCKAEPST
ncbi:Protein kinase-like domain [Cordyceps militaris CM01]|uniref:Protein kinase-like domain n=1 Tax=Cordyceps militaris (strain CM01) TaxID=983644 RepID=G3JMU8_CORMM|nr:Protein kinase-like domain [Cordyceps militaris CM01]EGX90130.1 Protein kinase-like domain [Cordyceps militaris CM01]